MHQVFVSIQALFAAGNLPVAAAYLLVRGPLLATLFPRRSTATGRCSHSDILLSGALFGAAVASEYFFPNLRFPGFVQTLLFTFATLVCGTEVTVVAMAVALATALSTAVSPSVLGATLSAGTASLLIGGGLCHLRMIRRISDLANRSNAQAMRSLGVIATGGMAAQALALCLQRLLAASAHYHFPNAYSATNALVSLPIQGIDLALLLLVLWDARQRSEVSFLRNELKSAQAVAAQQRVAALRARIQPHFLFNTLNSIAGLCATSPERAEIATLQLGDVMRHAFDAPDRGLTELSQEIAEAQTYLEIERYRYEERLRVEWRTSTGADTALIPPFTLVTLIDNAVNHGIASQVDGGNIVVTVRQLKCASRIGGQDSVRAKRILIAVQDDGIGISPSTRRSIVKTGDRPHGLPILDEQMRLIFGPQARLRLFSRPDCGTLAVFVVPILMAPR